MQANGPSTAKMQKAEDIGRKAWMPGSVVGGQEKVRSPTPERKLLSSNPFIYGLVRMLISRHCTIRTAEVGALRTCVMLLQAVRQIKGILNKLTPENFDRLLQQVLDIVNDAELLHATIKLVFENAVAQPTFSFMYAQFCAESSKVPPARPASLCLTA